MSKNKLYILTKEFYTDYSDLKEIIKKASRPYFMYHLFIGDFEFAIPLRSNINHKHSYLTGEKDGNKCGLDFTKAVIIQDKSKYLESTIVKIRENEYKKIRGNEHLIKKAFEKYIKTYKKSHKITSIGKGSHFEKMLCRYSTLQNYHKELKIEA